MKKSRGMYLLFACLLLTGFASSQALAGEAPASIYIVHGIPGHDLSTTLDPALPVDIQVDGSICLVTGLKFGDIAGPFTIPANTYSVAILAANTVAPCTGTTLLGPASVTITAGENASVVAYLSATGAPGVKKFENDLSPTPNGDSRLIVQHTAAAPAVDITVARDKNEYSEWPYARKIGVLRNVSNSQQASPLIPSGAPNNFPLTQVTFTPAGATNPVIGPYFFQLVPHTAYLIYAVGSLSTGSFTVISKAIPGV